MNLDLKGLPTRFARAEYQDLPEGELRNKVGEYLRTFDEIQSKGIGLLFLGPVRTWKTHAAAVICRWVYTNKKCPVEFVACQERFVQMDINKYGDETRALIKRWCKVPLLVMDDFIVSVGIGKGIAVAVMASRFNACLPTIWTGNLSGDRKQFQERLNAIYGPSFTRRLRDTSEGFRIFTG